MKLVTLSYKEELIEVDRDSEKGELSTKIEDPEAPVPIEERQVLKEI